MSSRPRHRIGALVAVFATLLLLPSVALADKPERIEIGPMPEPFTLPAGAICPFPIQYEELDVKVTVLIWGDPEGIPDRVHTSGKYKVRFTNLETGESVDLNISGPSTITFTEEGLPIYHSTGRNFFGLFPGLDEGGPALLLTTGLVVWTRTPEGGIDFIEQHGQTRDICAMLSD